MELKDLRSEAASNVRALHNQSRTHLDCSLETLAHFFRRSVRTLRRWEAAPDRVTEFAYRYLAGHLFGWESVRWNLRRKELELWHSAAMLTTAHRNHIQLLPELLAFWHRSQQLQAQPLPGGASPIITPIALACVLNPQQQSANDSDYPGEAAGVAPAAGGFQLINNQQEKIL